MSLFRCSHNTPMRRGRYGTEGVMLVATRIGYIALTNGEKPRYLVVDALLNPTKQEAAA